MSQTSKKHEFPFFIKITELKCLCESYSRILTGHHKKECIVQKFKCTICNKHFTYPSWAKNHDCRYDINSYKLNINPLFNC